jgi:hypothetical protein
LPFSRASEAAGFFFGTSPGQGMDFSLLKSQPASGVFQGLHQR